MPDPGTIKIVALAIGLYLLLRFIWWRMGRLAAWSATQEAAAERRAWTFARSVGVVMLLTAILVAGWGIADIARRAPVLEDLGLFGAAAVTGLTGWGILRAVAAARWIGKCLQASEDRRREGTPAPSRVSRPSLPKSVRWSMAPSARMASCSIGLAARSARFAL